MKNIDEIKLRDMGIFDLRNLARDVGVLSPTTQKKEELISKIVQILNGETSPQVPKSRQGRPPKGHENVRVNYKLDIDSLDDEMALFDSYSRGDYRYDEKFDFKNGSGYLKKIKNNYFLFGIGRAFAIKNAILVPFEIVEKYHLKEGDFVKCVYKNSINYNTKIVTKINNLNQLERKVNFEDLNLNFNKSNDKVCDFIDNVYLGDRVVLNVSNLINYANFLDSLSSDCEKKGTTLINLCLDSLPELDVNRQDYFCTLMGDNAKVNMLTCELAIARVMRMVESGAKVVLCINEIMKIAKYQNFFCNAELNAIKDFTLNTISRLYKLAGIYSNGASVTVIGFLKQGRNIEFNDYIVNELENFGCKFIDKNNM